MACSHPPRASARARAAAAEAEAPPAKKAKKSPSVTAAGKSKAKSPKAAKKPNEPVTQQEPIARAPTPSGPSFTVRSLRGAFLLHLRPRFAHHCRALPCAGLLQAISWNVDGLRAPGRTEVLAKLVADEAPDMICLQETKLQESHVKDWEGVLEGYTSYWSCSTVKKGYAGTAVFLKSDSSSTPTVSFGIGDKAHDGEGRSITVE